MLTGLIEVGADYNKVNITIEAFSAKDSKLTPIVAKFSAEGDTALLHDLGKSYSVARSLPAKRTANAVRNVIFKEVKKRDDEPTPDKPTNNDGSGTMVGDIEFKLVSDGQPVTIKAGTNNDPTMQVDCPEPGKPVVFSITNKGSSNKKLGVDVKLNGTSLLLRQAEAPEACRVWVLEPGKTYTLKGYYDESGDKNVAPFTIISGDAAKQAREQLGDKAGLIQVNVFDEVPGEQPTEEMLISSRGLRSKLSKRGDLHAVQTGLMRSALVKRVTKTEGGKKRELIVEDTDETKKLMETLKAVEFKKGSAPIASTTIKVIPPATNAGNPGTTPEDKKPLDKPADKNPAKPADKAPNK